MELTKQKYKQTTVGLIPEDWEVKSFKEIFKVNQGLQIAIDERHKYPSSCSKKYITIQYLNEGKNVEYINNYSESVCCNAKDVLMTRTGNTGMVITNVDGVFHNNFFKINFDRKKLDKDYIVFYLRQDSTQRKILQKAGTSTIPDLNHNDFYSLEIPLPPALEEQKAIATALSDVDELISNLDQLITKKKAIKQGAMQELLQPKESWEVKKLGEIFNITAGGDLNTKSFSIIQDDKYCYPIYSNALTNKGLYGYSSEYKQNENTITVTARGQVGVANPRNHKYVAIGRVIMLNPISKLDINFISEFINNFVQFSNESTGVPQLTAPQISNYEVTFPDIKEQTRRATILTDMDREIEKLETKKAKYHDIKQGMMQELLTGKTRLV